MLDDKTKALLGDRAAQERLTAAGVLLPCRTCGSAPRLRNDGIKIDRGNRFLEKECDFDGWGMCRKSWVRIWDSKRADLIHIDYDFDDYGKTWLAYAYPPAHIDMEARTAEWVDNDKSEEMMCKCSKCGYPVSYFWGKTEFCPGCGRAMTPEARAELEKRLRG